MATKRGNNEGSVYQRGDRRGLVFCDELGEPLSGTALTRRFQRKLADLGLPRQRWHDEASSPARKWVH